MDAFETLLPDRLPTEPAPDGAAVRPLGVLAGAASVARFELAPGQLTRPVTHRSVAELWHVLSGSGRLWRRRDGHQEVTELRAGVTVTLPLGTHFQFRADQDGLVVLGVTAPPWPAAPGEAWEVPGHWPVDGPRPGLDPDGYFRREGSLDLVAPEFAPVLAGAVEAVRTAFGPDRLHSAYLYGSIPRGTAEAGRSDLDLLLVLHQPPGPADRAALDALAAELDQRFGQINGVGALLFDVERLLSAAERYDLGWFLACLCTPLLGPDLAERLPRYRPEDPELARETNGELADWLPRWRERAAAGADPRALTRGAARKLVRTGLTLVMARWRGWTSDLGHSAEVFAAYYPEQADRMRRAAAAARVGSADPAVLALLLDELGPWLAAEYTRVHGVKGSAG